VRPLAALVGVFHDNAKAHLAVLVLNSAEIQTPGRFISTITSARSAGARRHCRRSTAGPDLGEQRPSGLVATATTIRLIWRARRRCEALHPAMMN